MASRATFRRPGAALALVLLLTAVGGSAEPAVLGSRSASEPGRLCAATGATSGEPRLAEVRRIAVCDQCRTSGRRAGFKQCCELVGGDYRCEWVRC